MSSNDYYIFPEEKLAIQKMLEDNRQKYFNFIIDSLENNLSLGNFEPEIWNYYNNTEEVLNYFSKLYLAIFKDELNNKNKLEKVYIPMSLQEFNVFASSKEFLGLLTGTKDQFVAKTKDFKIDDLVIVEAELKNIPVYITKEEFNILETVILAPAFTIEQTGEIEKIEGRVFVKFTFENISYSTKKEIDENLFVNIVNDSENQANNLKKYYDIETENRLISLTLADTKRELLKIQESEKKNKENIDGNEDINIDIEKNKERIAELAKQIEENIDKFSINQSRMENSIGLIRVWKDNVREYLENIFVDAIMEIELERTKIRKAESLTVSEKDFFADLQKALKSNKDEAEKILKRTEELIKIEQKFAKIAADCGANYIAVSDGFKMREAALELLTIMENIYQEFEEYYIARTSGGARNEVKEARYKKILDNDNQIGILINLFNNAKSAKPGTSLDRFDELALIEENELKRQITEYVFKNIADGHVEILNDEIDNLENKSTIQKMLLFLSGKKDIEDFKICENEFKIEKIEEKLTQEFSIEESYSIHKILAYTTMFKEENKDSEDEYLEKIIQKLELVENTIDNNFSVNIDKVAEIILEKTYKNLPISKEYRDMKELQKIEYETDAFLKQYGYDTINDNVNKKYPYAVAKEIKKIVDYARVTF